jgi:hypothetical protein
MIFSLCSAHRLKEPRRLARKGRVAVEWEDLRCSQPGVFKQRLKDGEMPVQIEQEASAKLAWPSFMLCPFGSKQVHCIIRALGAKTRWAAMSSPLHRRDTLLLGIWPARKDESTRTGINHFIPSLSSSYAPM